MEEEDDDGADAEDGGAGEGDDEEEHDHWLMRGVRAFYEPIFDMALKGKTARISSIEQDYEDQVHLAVTVDDDPGQDLMRQTGRYLFFFPHEVQQP